MVKQINIQEMHQQTLPHVTLHVLLQHMHAHALTYDCQFSTTTTGTTPQFQMLLTKHTNTVKYAYHQKKNN